MAHSNPFSLLKSEQIISELKFHDFYGPQMIGLLSENKDYLWNRLNLIRSASGGGKTSLMRLFTIESLNHILEKKDNQGYYQLLFNTVSEVGAIDNSGPKVLGVLISCTSPYPKIIDLDITEVSKTALLCALINVRLLMKLLESACIFCSLQFPKDLNRIKLIPHINNLDIFNLNGQGLFEYAESVEREICNITDSVQSKFDYNMPFGFHELFMWKNISEIQVDDRRIKTKILYMLDDFQYLSKSQRQLLLNEFKEPNSCSCWIAERHSATECTDLYQGITPRREYIIHNIEQWAHHSKSKFDSALEYIANRRIAYSKLNEVATFSVLLKTTDENPEADQKAVSAAEKISSRVKKLVEQEKRFQSWINNSNTIDIPALEKAITWRALEILIHRKRKRDNTLFPDWELPVEEMDNMNSINVQQSARLFVCKEFNLPYYYGFDTFKTLSSGNIEQFLQISGAAYNIIIAAATLRRRSPTLSCKQQEAMIKKIARERLEQIPVRIPLGSRVKNLIDKIGLFACEKTFELTAPYAPGVTGIGITEYDFTKLFDTTNHRDQNLREIISESLSNSILELRKIRCKNQVWQVFYLNRLLCVNYYLPLSYGGWKEQSLSTLNNWAETKPQLTQGGFWID